jgi:hypothetical protein
MLVTENHDLNFAVPFNGVSVCFRVICETQGDEQYDYDRDSGMTYNHSVEWDIPCIDIYEIMVTDSEGDKVLRADSDCNIFGEEYKNADVPTQEEIDFAKNWVKENVEHYATEQNILELNHLAKYSL